MKVRITESLLYLFSVNVLITLVFRYSTAKNYSFIKHEFNEYNYEAGTFTLLVWNTIKKVGCGIAHHNVTQQSYVRASK